MYEFSKSWFDGSELKRKLLVYVDKSKQIDVLEIGCFEGASACFFSDNILDHESSTLDCVDPFFISGTVDGITTRFIVDKTIDTFKSNISKSKNSGKITFHNETSDDFFEKNKKMYNLIYIDGCHEPDYITRDLNNAFKVLEKGGIIWMDDYRGGSGDIIKNTIDSILQNYLGQFILIHMGYQLAIRKL